MSELTNINLVTPLELLVSKEVKMAVMPGTDGDLGIMVKHTPLMTLLRRGFVKLYDDGNNLIEEIAVDGGVAEVNEQNITILCERAETINTVNKQIIEEKIKNCEKQINDHDDTTSTSAKKESDFLYFVLNKIN